VQVAVAVAAALVGPMVQAALAAAEMARRPERQQAELLILAAVVVAVGLRGQAAPAS
jgi:ABC-type enterochelin transport system permease subunit